MEDARRLTVISVALAGVIAVAMSDVSFTLWDFIIGAILLTILIVFALPDENRKGEVFFFSLVFSLSFLITIGLFIDILVPEGWKEIWNTKIYQRHVIHFFIWGVLVIAFLKCPPLLQFLKKIRNRIGD